MRRGRRHLRAALFALCVAIGSTARAAPYEPSRLSVEGTPEEIGRQIGEAYGPEIKAFIPYFVNTAVLASGRPRPELYARAQQMAEHIADEDLRVMRGIAGGAQLPYEDVLVLNLWYHFVSERLLCRQLAAWGAWTEDGRLIHARNLDWPELPGGPLLRHNLILNVKPSEGIEYLALTWPGLVGTITGTNRHGITLGFNQLLDGRAEGRVAEPVFLTLRRVLRTCESVEQAAQLIRDARPMGNGSILISGAGARTALVVEIYDGHVAERRPEDEMIGNANHVTTDLGVPGLEPGSPTWPTCTAARLVGKPLDPDRARQVMADEMVLQPINILSVIFVPEDNCMFLSCGRMRAAAGEFTRYELFPEPAPGDEASGQRDASGTPPSQPQCDSGETL